MRKAALIALAVLAPGFTAKASAQLNMQQALALAQQGNAGLTLLYSRAETKPTGQVWGFYFLKQNHIIEFELNPSGQVVQNTQVSKIPPTPTPPNTPTPNVPSPPNQGSIDPNVINALAAPKILTKLPSIQYIEIALQQNSGAATSFMTILVQGQLQVQVGGQSSGGSSWTVTMDMTTGQVIQGN